MVRACPKFKVPCYLPECSKGCKHNMKQARRCPAHGGTCYLGWCLSNDECLTQYHSKKGTDKMANFIVCPCALPDESNVCRDPGCLKEGKCLDEQFGLTALKPLAKPVTVEPWACPVDKGNCRLFQCNGGQTCISENDTNGAPAKPVTPVAVYKDCHVGMNSIGFINEAEIFVGKETSAKIWDLKVDGPIGMIIGLLGSPYPQGPVVGLNQQIMQQLPEVSKLQYIKPPIPNIWLAWPDYGIVPFDRQWWENLVAVIGRVKGAVLIYCMGGHGRTGTAASIIACLGGIIKPEDGCPVLWLRKAYCDKVVECNEQLDYIQHITGRPVIAEASKQAWTSHYGHGHSPYGHYHGHDYSEPKKKVTGGAGSGKKTSPPQKLSIKKWKQWWRGVDKRGEYATIASVTRPKDLPDGQVFRIGKRKWQWNASEHVFVEQKGK